MIRKLILGTGQLGLNYGINNKSGKPTLATAFDILHAAFDNGIRILDTAEAYGNSQEVIGAFLKENPEKKFHVISKLAANHSLLKNELLDHIDENLQTLSLDKLYGYMFHNYDSFKKSAFLYDDIVQSIERIKKDYRLNIETLALQYALQKDYIDHVLIGVDNRNQLISNLNICNAQENIPHHLIDTIDVEEIAMLNPANWNQ